MMTGYVRNGKEHSISEWSYRLYSWFILHTIGLRVFLKRCRIKAARFVKRRLYER